MPSEPMRLDEPGATFHYVSSSAEWKARCAATMMALNPELDAQAVHQWVDDMALRLRWRLMAPEEAVDAMQGLPYRPLRHAEGDLPG